MKEITLFIHLEIKKGILNYITLLGPALRIVPQSYEITVHFSKHNLYINFIVIKCCEVVHESAR